MRKKNAPLASATTNRETAKRETAKRETQKHKTPSISTERARVTSSIYKIIFIIATVIGVSALTYLLLRVLKVIYRGEAGEFIFNAELFYGLKSSRAGKIAIVLIQTSLSVLLCALPGASMAFVAVIKVLYPNAIEAFLLAFSSVILSSAITYFIGFFGGNALCERLIGSAELQKATKLLKNKTTAYFPLMMALPVFPDDALIMLAGTAKLSLKWFIPSVIIGRGIGTATIIFGLSLLPKGGFSALYEWFVFITVCAFWVCVLFYLAHKINLKIQNKN